MESYATVKGQIVILAKVMKKYGPFQLSHNEHHRNHCQN